MKVVINKCWGGFGLSLKGQKRLGELLGKDIYFYKQTNYNFDDEKSKYKKVNDLTEDGMFAHAVTKDLGSICSSDKELNDNYFRSSNIERNDLYLIQVIEELGSEANTKYSKLMIVEVPDDIEWEIDDYDGMETIEECHRSWC